MWLLGWEERDKGDTLCDDDDDERCQQRAIFRLKAFVMRLMRSDFYCLRNLLLRREYCANIFNENFKERAACQRRRCTTICNLTRTQNKFLTFTVINSHNNFIRPQRTQNFCSLNSKKPLNFHKSRPDHIVFNFLILVSQRCPWGSEKRNLASNR